MAVVSFNKKKNNRTTPSGSAKSSIWTTRQVYSDTKGYETGGASSIGGYLKTVSVPSATPTVKDTKSSFSSKTTPSQTAYGTSWSSANKTSTPRFATGARATNTTQDSYAEMLKQRNLGITEPTVPDLSDTYRGGLPQLPSQWGLDEEVQEPAQLEEPVYWEDVDPDRDPEYEAQLAYEDVQKQLQEAEAQQTVLDQAKYMQRQAEEKEYREAQRETQMEAEGIADESAEIQASQTIAKASSQLSSLRQRMNYLGTMGAPWVSQVALDWAQKQLSDAENVFKDMLKLESNNKALRALGSESKSMAFARDMQLLQNDLDDKVDKIIQWVLNKFSAADMKGEFDSVEDVQRLAAQWLADTDLTVDELTRANLQEKQFKMEEAANRLDEMKLYAENKNTVNTDMSKALGYYVDWNGNALIWSDGNPIVIPEDPPMEPVMDLKTGKLITFELNEDGQIVAKVQDVLDIPETQNEWKSDWLGGYFRTGLDWKLETQFGWGGGWWGWGWSNNPNMRTDRNNNPTAMTTDVAKTLWLVEWVDYTVWDPFQWGNWNTLYTAKLIWDWVTTTIKWLDNAALDPNKSAFLTWGGAPRRTHTSMTDQEWLALDQAWKQAVVAEMYRREWGNGSLVWESANTNFDASLEPFYEKYLKWELTTADQKSIASMGKDFTTFTQEATAYKGKRDQDMGEHAKSLLPYINDLLTLTEKEFLLARNPLATGKARNNRQSYQSLKSSVALQKLVDLKANGATFGSLSNNELNFIDNASTNLNLWGNYEKFREILQSTKDGLTQGMATSGIDIYDTSGSTPPPVPAPWQPLWPEPIKQEVAQPSTSTLTPEAEAALAELYENS